VKTQLATELAYVDASQPEIGHRKERKGGRGTDVVGPRSESISTGAT